MSEPQPLGDVISLDELRARNGPPGPQQEPPARTTPPSVPARYRADLTALEQTDPVKAARAWIDSYQPGRGLLLVGPVGTGKSTIAGALATLLQAPTRCSFWPVRALIAAIKAEMDTPREGYTVTQKITRRPALVLDDLGTELPTGWQLNTVAELIDDRYDNQLTLVATTNLTPRQLEERLGERTVSRLHEMCDLVKVTGTDRRRQP